MIRWILDSSLMDKEECDNFVNAIKNNNCKHYFTQYVPFTYDLPNLPKFENEKLFFYGTVGFCQGALKHYPNNVFLKEEEMKVSNYSKYYLDVLMNSDLKFLKYKELVDNWGDIIDKPFFIRPDDGIKSFTGKVFYPEDKELFISDSKIKDRIIEESIVIISSPKNILAESRFVIGNNKVITYSTYRYNGKLDIRKDVFNEQIKLAEEVAKMPYQIDKFYVCDIAKMNDNTCKVIEFNNFSCSGLYYCDLNKIIESVNEHLNFK